MITISSGAGVALGKALAELEAAEQHANGVSWSARRMTKNTAMDRLRQARAAFDEAARAVGQEIIKDRHHEREGD